MKSEIKTVLLTIGILASSAPSFAADASASNFRQILLTISQSNVSELQSQVRNGFAATNIRLETPEFNISDCYGSIQSNGKLQGHCWFHDTAYTPSSLEEIQRRVDNNGYGTSTQFVVRANDESRDEDSKAIVERVSRRYYSAEITADADGSNPKIRVAVLE